MLFFIIFSELDVFVELFAGIHEVVGVVVKGNQYIIDFLDFISCGSNFVLISFILFNFNTFNYM